jgi:putative ABC transport system permease protein
MPMLFATAELRRSRARFGFLTVGAGLLVFVLLFQQALLAAVLDGMTGAITHQSGPVLVYAREAQRSFGGSLITPDQQAAVASSPSVADAAELATTLLSYQAPGGGDELVNVSVIGFRAGRPGAPTGLSSGRLPEQPGEAVVSSEDAVGFGIGDVLTIEPGGVPVEVVGLTTGGRYNVGPTLWTPWETYDQLVRLATPDTVIVLPSVLAVDPAPGITPAQLANDLNAMDPAIEALTREDAAAKAPGRDAIQIAFLAVIGLGYLVVAVVIGFFFLTMTLHKEPSITLMRAVGAKGNYLVRCLLVQVAVVTFGGLGVGILMLIAVAPVVRSTIAVTVDPLAIAQTVGPVMAVALLGAIPPLRRVMRIDPYQVVTRPSLGGLG